jgi:hypothetical protein
MFYSEHSDLYDGTSKLKNVKREELYQLAIKVDIKDLDEIVSRILYLYLVKENHDIRDINSMNFLNFVTRVPGRFDKNVNGIAMIPHMEKTYDTTPQLVKALITLLGVYIVRKSNEVRD